jgi:hypothetical protein
MSALSTAFRGWLAGSAGMLVLAAALGVWPTLRWGGEGALGALAAGCGVGWIGSLAGTLPVLREVGRRPGEAPNVVALRAMAWRAVATLAAGALALFAGRWPRMPLLVWAGVAYVALLVVETRWTIRWLGAGGR